MKTCKQLPETEETSVGRQTLIQGVAPVNLRERLQWKANAPLEPSVKQKRCDAGLFDLESRRQIDLIDELRRLNRRSPPSAKENE